MIQMFLMAIGVVIALATFSSFSKADAKSLGIVLAVLILMFFIFITFFKVSELNLMAFIAKKVKDVFLDTTQKYQTNMKKYSPTDILIAKSHQKETKQKIKRNVWKVINGNLHHTDCPPINRFVVPSSENNLWCQVVWCTNNAVSLARRTFRYFWFHTWNRAVHQFC